MCIALVVRHKCFHSVFSSLEAIHQDDDGEQLMSASCTMTQCVSNWIAYN